ncbi:hypothetical protein FJV46_12255 [Arthrobacter agilis]|uniref:hypothetical protein n=1 Tax=Arthrobacter agilis TaxID=37921 RepID=UPI000B360A42|nr:hypothetical protein [Arthrobacter agilis]OUM45042.1 hypothetical protein B8W74_02025 [Arthrobacter agilis]PPB46893.1 hypothetical protein CI784_04150 [Arthrobacter agilis]TPV23515.1 hypothetical protein FJV46_12255 [Arthrobacter agilis]VDR31912.1 Uncharacterised protein [Arthrobacter agilis]
MGTSDRDDRLHSDGAQIIGFLGAVLLTIPIVIRLAEGGGNGFDWVFLAVGIGLAGYWVVLALRGRQVRRAELAELRRLRDSSTAP